MASTNTKNKTSVTPRLQRTYRFKNKELFEKKIKQLENYIFHLGFSGNEYSIHMQFIVSKNGKTRFLTRSK